MVVSCCGPCSELLSGLCLGYAKVPHRAAHPLQGQGRLPDMCFVKPPFHGHSCSAWSTQRQPHILGSHLMPRGRRCHTHATKETPEIQDAENLQDQGQKRQRSVGPAELQDQGQERRQRPVGPAELLSHHCH